MSDTQADVMRPWMVEIAKVHGVPTVMLVAIMYGGWQATEWVGASVVEPLVKRQIAFMDAIEATMTQQETAIRDVSILVRQIESSQKQIADTLEELKQCTSEQPKSSP